MFELPEILVLEVSIPRQAFSGDLNNDDVYGGMFYSRLVHMTGGQNDCEPVLISPTNHEAPK